jgi:hypothetical protein
LTDHDFAQILAVDLAGPGDPGRIFLGGAADRAEGGQLAERQGGLQAAAPVLVLDHAALAEFRGVDAREVNDPVADLQGVAVDDRHRAGGLLGQGWAGAGSGGHYGRQYGRSQQWQDEAHEKIPFGPSVAVQETRIRHRNLATP